MIALASVSSASYAKMHAHGHIKFHKYHHGYGHKPTSKVPEIDAASGGIALALVGGIFLIARERRRTTKDTFAAESLSAA